MIIERLEKIIETLRTAGEDAIKCESGNVSAGRRVRKVCSEVTKEIKELRAIILEHSKR